MLVCFGPGRAGLGLECVGPGRASGLSTSGRAGPRAWIEDFGPGSGLDFRPVATSTMYAPNEGITRVYLRREIVKLMYDMEAKRHAIFG